MSDTFVSILEHEPDWAALPAGETPTPSEGCWSAACERTHDKRLHDIADALIELEDASKPIASTRPRPMERRNRRPAVGSGSPG